MLVTYPVSIFVVEYMDQFLLSFANEILLLWEFYKITRLIGVWIKAILKEGSRTFIA